MLVLGIETSCDETASAVVEDGKKILSSEVASSLNFHKKYGGIVPEIAFRMQLETITQAADYSLNKARIKLKDISLISVTDGPGLLGSLLVGVSFAKAVSIATKIPLLGINHLHSHIYAPFFKEEIAFPFVALVVSGGHTSLFYVKDFDKINLLGSTLDDACGESFDKVAKILGLGYPGGALIEAMGRKGDQGKIRFNCCDTEKPMDFSFSGIKTAVLYLIKKQGVSSLQRKQDIAFSFQDSVISALIAKALAACKIKKSTRLVIGGGVAVNNKLRERFIEESSERDIKCYFPPRQFCMDNAAMVSGLGYRLFRKGYKSKLGLTAQLN